MEFNAYIVKTRFGYDVYIASPAKTNPLRDGKYACAFFDGDDAFNSSAEYAFAMKQLGIVQHRYTAEIEDEPFARGVLKNLQCIDAD